MTLKDLEQKLEEAEKQYKRRESEGSGFNARDYYDGRVSAFKELIRIMEEWGE